MLKLPTPLIQQFDNLLQDKSLPDKDRASYKKWLHFYWDFCHKYHHDAFHSNSLPLFIHKLENKNQSVQQQKQAEQAISLFLNIRAISEKYQIKREDSSIE